MKYFLSLGSNIGDREKNLGDACFLLEKAHIKVLRSSSIYETQPVDYASQPWFLNQMLEVSTEFLPDDLLAVVKTIETKLGRIKSLPKGPRKIDIDIILAGKFIHQTPKLKIPHPKMHKRNFVLMPLREIEPGAVHPILKKNVEALVKENDDPSEIRKYDSG
jgi:2-amino-4-hydroxy-6-hydroxymethyldihydropteridine diphosphokinase